MNTNLENLLEQSGQSEPTWRQAGETVRKLLNVPTHVAGLFRAGWMGQAQPKETIKVLGFSRLNPACLLNAAGLHSSESNPEGADIEHSLQILGPRFSSVVLAVNLLCRQVLATKPPLLWRKIFEEMMTSIELGYRIGSRVFDLGVHGGSLAGFALNAGHALLLASQPRLYRDWTNSQKAGVRMSEADFFGCSAYQVASLAVQQLGFGHQIAIGIACGGGGIREASFKMTDEILFWKAAYLWVEALRSGKQAPADRSVAGVFSELSRERQGDKNSLLEVICTETGSLRQTPSNWTWHLPRPGYQETIDSMGYV